MLALLGAALIAAATLTPAGRQGGGAPPWCLVCGPTGAADALANVLLFVPLGAGLALRGWPARRALTAVAAATLAIELLQWRLVVGRDASLGDLATNVTGGVLGYGTARRRRALVDPDPRRASAFAAAWAAGWVGGSVLTAWALAPAVPEGRWWSYLPSSGAGTAANFVALRAELSGLPLRHGPVPQPEVVRPGLLSGDPVVATLFRRDPLPPFSNIVYMEDNVPDIEVLNLAKAPGRVTFQLRTRSADLRLRTPGVQLSDLPVRPGGDTLRVTAGLREGRLSLALASGGARRARTLDFGPNLGWMLAAPLGYLAGPEWRLLTALWVALLALPIGFWAARAAPAPGPRVAAWAALAAQALALALVPPAFALPAVHWSEWAAFVCGAAAGAAASVVLRRQTAPGRAAGRAPPGARSA